MKRFLKTSLKYTLYTIVVLIALAAVVPFLIPVKPLDGLAPARTLATEDSRFVTIPFAGTDGLDIHYFDQAAIEPDENRVFVLMHGSVFNANTWDEVIDGLSQYGRVVAYDQIPYGLSEKPLSGTWSEDNPYTSEAAISQLFSFLDTLGLEHVVLVGNSYGSTLAVRAALAQPERITAMILGDPAVYVQESMPAWLMSLPQTKRMGPLLARTIGASEGFIRQTYLDAELISEERMRATLVHTGVQNWDAALWEYLSVWKTPDLSGDFAAISQPVLVLTGAQDAIVPVSDSRKLDVVLPYSSLAILPACGHVPQEECPDAYLTAVSTWLGQIGE